MPRRVAVIGAGMVGLSTAWFPQEHGYHHVTVYDRRHVAAGSSWGNAGWLTPAQTAPLPEPAVLSYGMKAVLSPSAPVYVPLRPSPHLLRILTGFARNSTARRWGGNARICATEPARDGGLRRTFDGGVEAQTHAADPFLACFRTPEERAPLLEGSEHIQAAGQDVKYDVLTGHEARIVEPSLSPSIGSRTRQPQALQEGRRHARHVTAPQHHYPHLHPSRRPHFGPRVCGHGCPQDRPTLHTRACPSGRTS